MKELDVKVPTASMFDGYMENIDMKWFSIPSSMPSQSQSENKALF